MHTLDFQTYRLQLVRETAAADVQTVQTGDTLDCPSTVSRLLQPLFESLDREHFVVLALDARNRPIGCNTVSIGTLSASLVHPREVFKFAILANAAAVILAHNHPSGEVSPSKDDIDLTRRLVQVGEVVGIEVLDHVVLGGQDFCSLKEQGVM